MQESIRGRVESIYRKRTTPRSDNGATIFATRCIFVSFTSGVISQNRVSSDFIQNGPQKSVPAI